MKRMLKASRMDKAARADSARCDQMTGEQREQCLNDEGAKTQGAASPAK